MRILAALILVGLTSTAFAGQIKDEFEKVANELKELEDTPTKRKEQREKTLNLALQRALLRYYNYPDYKKAKLAESDYELSETHEHTYYFKFKDFIGYFVFTNSPEFYFSYPVEEKILLKPGGEIPKDAEDVEQ